MLSFFRGVTTTSCMPRGFVPNLILIIERQAYAMIKNRSCGAKTWGAGGGGVRLRSVGACVRWLLRLESRVGASGAWEEGAELGRRLLGLNGEAGYVQKEVAGLGY